VLLLLRSLKKTLISSLLREVFVLFEDEEDEEDAIAVAWIIIILADLIVNMFTTRDYSSSLPK
jgi:hypothetical protein